MFHLAIRDQPITMMSQSKISPLEAKGRIKNVQEKCIPLTDVCSPTVATTIQAHADAIGCPSEYIFYPLLMIAAGFMGVRTQIQINEEWKEPAIIWMVVAARKGNFKK